jgi:DNA-binding transcriptional regulator YiaG
MHAIRIKFNGKQADLAKAAGVPKQLIHNFLTGRSKSIRTSSLEKLRPFIDEAWHPGKQRECLELCKDMSELEIEMIRNYKKLDITGKKQVYRLVENLDEMAKKRKAAM